jgi:opacity protein-like surface antigen
MKKSTLLASAAVALLMSSAAASAQVQQKGSEEKSPQAAPKEQGATPKGDQSNQKGAQQQQPSTGKAAKGETDQKGMKGAEQKQPKDQGSKGSAQTQPKDQGSKGSAQTQPKDQGSKGSAQTQPKDQGSKGASKESTGGRVQISEQQRTNVHQTILKESNVNRINQVNFSINVGTRVPRSVHLVALPASVISLVPQYRSYRYFVANDQVCIVDPNSYEIVEVIAVSNQTARAEDRGGSARLVLTEEEKTIILQNVDMKGGSTLALGSLSEGAAVPREARLETFSDTVVQQVPKVRGYKFFTAEDRLAIVDPQGTKVQLVIESRR